MTARVLQRERAFLRSVIDADPSLIFVKNRQGCFVLGNEAVARCYGTTPQAIQGKTDADFNSNLQEVAHFRHDDLEVMDTQQPKVIAQEQVTFANSQTHWFSTVKVPLINDDGTCDQVLGVATDITERKEAEEQLRTLNATLEERVAERTAEAEERAAQLGVLALELTRTEQRERERIAQVLHDHLQQSARRSAVQRIDPAQPSQRPAASPIDRADRRIA